MKLRTLFAFILAITSALSARAQPLPTVGIMTLGVGTSSRYIEAFRAGVRNHGYVEGKNIAFEIRSAEGYAERLPALAAEMVRMKVRVIVVESGPAALAASKATKTIPIIMAIGVNPVKLGLAASLARPGGNVTGLTLAGAERAAKQLQLLKESIPAAREVAVLYSPRPDIEDDLKEASKTATALDLSLRFYELRSPKDFDSVFNAVADARPSGLITIGHGMLFGNNKRIAEFALANRLPGVFPEREFADAGGLMAYGPDIGFSFGRAAGYVDKILKGAKPGELPIEQPTKWGLVVNMRTAKALGLKVPAAVLVRADEVIQ
jgi:putative ABC transport system substrate-binding protein